MSDLIWLSEAQMRLFGIGFGRGRANVRPLLDLLLSLTAPRPTVGLALVRTGVSGRTALRFHRIAHHDRLNRSRQPRHRPPSWKEPRRRR